MADNFREPDLCLTVRCKGIRIGGLERDVERKTLEKLICKATNSGTPCSYHEDYGEEDFTAAWKQVFAGQEPPIALIHEIMEKLKL